MEKQRLFSVTKDDCEWQFFRGTGNGGQKRNKTSSCVRVIHRASGAVGECREERSQHVNRQRAFRRMAETKEFQSWLKLEAAKRMGLVRDIETVVEEALAPENLKIEVF